MRRARALLKDRQMDGNGRMFKERSYVCSAAQISTGGHHPIYPTRKKEMRPRR